MRILQINSVYGKGSTGKIVKDIHDYLISQHHESFVCYGRGESITEPGITKTCGEYYSKLNNLLSRINGFEYGNCHKSTNRLISEIEKIKPDVVHLHCLNGYYVNIFHLINYLKEKDIPVVLSLHAEFMYTANCGYAYDCIRWQSGCGNCPRLKEATKSLLIDNTAKSWRLMKDAFDGYENIIIASVSPWVMERAKLSPILSDKKHVVVLNGLDSKQFTYTESHIREEIGIKKNEKMIFHATPFFSLDENHIKGGIHVYNLAKKLLNSNIKVVVAGQHSDIPKLSNLVLLGNVNDQSRLASLYSAADLTILTSKRETFSMVCAESLSCGTPIVGYRAGAPEQISLPGYSIFVENGDLDALLAASIKMLGTDQEKNIISCLAREVYSSETMAKKYVELYEQVDKL